MLMHSRCFLPSVHAMFQVRCYVGGVSVEGEYGGAEDGNSCCDNDHFGPK